MLSVARDSIGTELADLIDRVKDAVDCRKLLPADREQEQFGKYVRIRCLNPEHPDTNPTFLCFADGFNCSACGVKGDAIDLYQLVVNPDATVREACAALLARPDVALSPDADTSERVLRTLDPDVAVTNHLALYDDKPALGRLLAYGLTPGAIQHFTVGYAEVLARLLPSVQDLAASAANIEWRRVGDTKVPYQRQRRFAVPMFSGGNLRQILYRKDCPNSLGAKVQLEKDCGAVLYGADDLAKAQSALIVEGWSDRVVLHQWGFTPANGWAVVTSSNGAGQWSAEWSALVGNCKRVYVAADADSAGQKMVARVKRDIRWAREVTLPWPAGTKRDFRDGWLAGWSRTDVIQLIRQADIRSSIRVTHK